MRSIKSPNIQLVGRSVWRAMLAVTLRDYGLENDQAISRRIRQLLSSAHNRHIGLSPDLTAAFMLAALGQNKLYLPWDTVLRRLNKEYEEVEGKKANPFDNSPQSSQMNLIRLDVSLGFMVSRLLFPLVEFATVRMGEVYLFCEEDLPDGPTVDEFRKYEETLIDTIRSLAANADGSMNNNHQAADIALFWKDCAISLGTLTQTGGRMQDKPHLADTNLPSLGLMTRLNPDLPFKPPTTLNLQTPVNEPPLKHRRLKSAGRRGIYVTRQEEALNRILHSEMVYPPAIRLDRILNTGFLALEKPPKPIKMRDILLVGVLPGDFYGTPMADFIKTCWFDFVMRVSRILHHNGLEQSEFRWVEGDRFGRMRSRGIALRTLPWLDLPRPQMDIQAYRQQFLTSLRWLPDFIDRQATWKLDQEGTLGNEPQNIVDPIETDEISDVDDPYLTQKKWLRFAWGQQKELAVWAMDESSLFDIPDDRFLPTPLDLQKYAFVSVMPFLPFALKPKEITEADQRLIAELRHIFRFGRQRRRFMTVTWAPSELNAPDDWRLQTSRRSISRLIKKSEDQATDTDEKITVEKIAGRLEKIWLDAFMKEIQYG